MTVTTFQYRVIFRDSTRVIQSAYRLSRTHWLSKASCAVHFFLEPVAIQITSPERTETYLLDETVDLSALDFS